MSDSGDGPRGPDTAPRGGTFGGRWFEEDERILSEINITPLVDVALVLLIIFMITAPMMVQGANVRLPRTERMDTLPQTQLIVSVREDGTVQINDELVPTEDLEQRLSAFVSPGRTVVFHGDERVDYGTVMRVMAVLKRLDADIALVTEPIPARR